MSGVVYSPVNLLTQQASGVVDFVHGTGVGKAISEPTSGKRDGVPRKHTPSGRSTAWKAFCFFIRNRVKVGAEFYC